MKKFKLGSKNRSRLLALAVVIVIVAVGFSLGRFLSYAYNNTEPIEAEFHIIIHEHTEEPINYVLSDGIETIQQLCAQNSGACSKILGIMLLNRIPVTLEVHANLSNLHDGDTFVRMDNRQIHITGALDQFLVFDERYFIFTELSLGHEYIIHIFDQRGTEVTTFNATNITTKLELNNNSLYFYYCDTDDYQINEEEERLYRFHRYRVLSNNVLEKVSVSSVFENCV